MQNIKSVINNHNMKVLNNTTEIEEGCNCRNRNNFPLDGKCLIPNIMYKAQTTSNQPTYKQKVYIGTAEADFKHRFNNHTNSFNLELCSSCAKCISCDEAIDVITWRSHCFLDCIYIMPVFLLRDLSNVCRGSLTTTYVIYTHIDRCGSK